MPIPKPTLHASTGAYIDARDALARAIERTRIARRRYHDATESEKPAAFKKYMSVSGGGCPEAKEVERTWRELRESYSAINFKKSDDG